MLIIFVVPILISSRTFSADKSEVRKPASVPADVQSIAKKMKMNDVRTLITEVRNTDGNPCSADGFEITLQIRKQVLGNPEGPAKYAWKTVRQVGVDKNGGIMELCQE